MGGRSGYRNRSQKRLLRLASSETRAAELKPCTPSTQICRYSILGDSCTIKVAPVCRVSLIHDGKWIRTLPISERMNPDSRIATRHVFESTIGIRFCRNGQHFRVPGWSRDLSASGMGAFVAEHLAIGEEVTLVVGLTSSETDEIPARVARQLGTQYGFQFIALSPKQRASILAAIKGQPPIPQS